MDAVGQNIEEKMMKERNLRPTQMKDEPNETSLIPGISRNPHLFESFE